MKRFRVLSGISALAVALVVLSAPASAALTQDVFFSEGTRFGGKAIPEGFYTILWKTDGETATVKLFRQKNHRIGVHGAKLVATAPATVQIRKDEARVDSRLALTIQLRLDGNGGRDAAERPNSPSADAGIPGIVRQNAPVCSARPNPTRGPREWDGKSRAARVNPRSRH